jgi:uncharacterized YccA/Bax inhibitor family protein
MSNPLLNDERLQAAAAANAGVDARTAGDTGPGWAAPKPGTQVGGTPIDDGPISPYHGGLMTVGGTATATLVLFLVLLVSASAGWVMTPTSETVDGQVQFQFPAIAIVGMFAGLGIAILLAFKPMLAKFLAPLYAIAQGFFVGAISKAYEALYDGIVVAAAGATLGVFFVMLVMYRTRIIKVTNRFRRIVIGATLGVMVFYLVSMLINLFGGDVGFLSSSSGLSIAFSFFVAGLAAFNLALDFDFIERAAAAGAPKATEWYAAFGILVTVVWLYLEILRLLSKLRQN